MIELLMANPWLVAVVAAAVVIVGCTAIVFVTDHLQKTHRAEIEASLKQDMLARGMSAEDIRTVLEASADGAQLRTALANQGVHLGLGKFQLELGALKNKPAAESSPS